MLLNLHMVEGELDLEKGEFLIVVQVETLLN